MKRTKKSSQRPRKGQVGRPPVYRNDRERARAKAQQSHEYQTSEEYKQRRKDRYRTDSEYRAACIARAKQYKAALHADEHALYAKRVRTRLGNPSGEVRPVVGNPRRVITFTIPEFARVIERPASAVRGWINSGRFPAPTWQAVTPRGLVAVYSWPQVQRLALAVVRELRLPDARLPLSRHNAIAVLHMAAKH